MTAILDNTQGYGVPNDTDGLVYEYDDGPIAGMVISNLGPSSGSGTFVLGASAMSGLSPNVSGTITVTSSSPWLKNKGSVITGHFKSTS